MGIVTAIEVQKHDKQRYNVFVDGNYAFAVHEDVIIKFNMLKDIGRDVSDETIAEITRAEDKQVAFNYAILLLSYRARSTKEITSRMRDKGILPIVIEETIDSLKRSGYIDDVEFAKVLIQDRQHLKKAGKNLIRQELWRKGVSKCVIDELVDEATDDDQEYNRAKDLASKKIRTYRNDDDRTKQRKLYSFLVRKGYSYEIVSRVIKELFSVEVED